MVPATFLERFGFLAVPGFLEPQACADLQDQLSGAEHTPAVVHRAGRHYEDRETRATRVIEVAESIEQEMHARLTALVPRLSAHFGVPLSGCGAPYFLRYQIGDFFAPHQDATPSPDADPAILARRVSVVVFLNASGEPESVGGYAGGDLMFHGLFGDQALSNRGLAVAPEAGLLLAFPSDVKHEVQPITKGTRYSIVTWFH